MQRRKKPLNPVTAMVLFTVVVFLGLVFLVLAFIGIIANSWGVLSGLLLGSILYYVRGWKE